VKIPVKVSFPGRLAAILLLLTFNTTFRSASGQILKPSPTMPNIDEELGVSILMRDGIRLAADVFHPHGSAHLPTVLIRTPYNRKNSSNTGFRLFVRRGFALVIEDVRGRFASQGSFGSIEQEGPDASDTINWIATQPWSDGRVAMAGSSYLGIVQWWAAIQDNPHLVAIAPMNAGDDEYLDRFYSTGGALKLGHRLLWVAQNFHPPSQLPPLFSSYIYGLPIRTADVPATGRAVPIWRDALLHPTYDAYWDSVSIRENLKRVTVPVLNMGGWFDNYGESEIDAFSRLARQGTPVETWMGPWAHDPGLRFPTRDFGPEAFPHYREIVANWLEHLMKPDHDDREPAPAPRLHLFVMGPNAWREEHEWPLARTNFTPLYLDSNGHANSAAGDGVLHWQLSQHLRPDTFTYDPKNPVPTAGGPICCDPRILPPGPLDQSGVEQRSDVLVYSSPALTEDLEVTGPVRAKLFIATSANDTDFTAKLVDVQPGGRPLSITDGIQRLRYRLSLDKPVFVKRNARYQITVDVGVTSYVFGPGHRIRLEISSSNFPRFDRNLNTTHAIADETKLNKARQTIYHEENFRSVLILPIIPHNHRR
jgi:predicted acyl esterase